MSPPVHDIIVLSDLHLGRGRNPDTGRYHSLEAFFYDDDLRRFLRWCVDDATRRGVPFKLVFNGDCFDFLRIEPSEPGPAAGRRERRFGPALTPDVAARILAEILRGHHAFLDGVVDVLAAGYEVIFLPGNHDIELQWVPVQAELRHAIVDRLHARGADVPTASALLRFESWFYHEPHRIWIEHGCQYDEESAFRYPLRGDLAADPPEAVAERTELDLPLGSFIQRYLFNAFGPITFMVPSTRANFRYFKWLMLNRPRLLARVVTSHGPFAIQLLRRIARGAAVSREALRRAHEAELERLVAASGLGDKLRAIDALKEVHHDVLQAARSALWQALRFAVFGMLVAILGSATWFAGFHTINQLRVGFGLKALSFLGLNFALFVAVAVGMGYALFRTQPAAPAGPLQRAATAIAETVDVPLVTFGHTHDEAVWCLRPSNRARAWYFNTGTWIAVFTHDELMPRERVQFNFLRVRGTEGELLQWSPGRGEPMPVILLDEEARGGQPVHAGSPPAA